MEKNGNWRITRKSIRFNSDILLNVEQNEEVEIYQEIPSIHWCDVQNVSFHSPIFIASFSLSISLTYHCSVLQQINAGKISAGWLTFLIFGLDLWSFFFSLNLVSRINATLGFMDTSSWSPHPHSQHLHLHNWPTISNVESSDYRWMDITDQMGSKARCWYIWLSGFIGSNKELFHQLECYRWVMSFVWIYLQYQHLTNARCYGSDKIFSSILLAISMKYYSRWKSSFIFLSLHAFRSCSSFESLARSNFFFWVFTLFFMWIFFIFFFSRNFFLSSLNQRYVLYDVVTRWISIVMMIRFNDRSVWKANDESTIFYAIRRF